MEQYRPLAGVVYSAESPLLAHYTTDGFTATPIQLIQREEILWW